MYLPARRGAAVYMEIEREGAEREGVDRARYTEDPMYLPAPTFIRAAEGGRRERERERGAACCAYVLPAHSVYAVLCVSRIPAFIGNQ